MFAGNRSDRVQGQLHVLFRAGEFVQPLIGLGQQDAIARSFLC